MRFSQPSSASTATIVSSIPIIIAPTAAASELPFCRREPIQSHPTGTPTHRTRLPTNIITTSSAALSTAGSDAARLLHQRNPRPPDRRLNSSRKA